MNKTNYLLSCLIVVFALSFASCSHSKKIQKNSPEAKANKVIDKEMDKLAKELKDVFKNAKVERVGDGVEVQFSNNVFFEFDRYALRDSAFLTLRNFIKVLNKYPHTDVEVQGHTDNQGDNNYNVSLSEKRANSAATFLKENDLKAERVTTKGFGAAMPAYDNTTEEGRQMNRRVEFLIKPSQMMRDNVIKKANG